LQARIEWRGRGFSVLTRLAAGRAGERTTRELVGAPAWLETAARGLGGGPVRLKTTADSAGTAGVEAESWGLAPWGVRRRLRGRLPTGPSSPVARRRTGVEEPGSGDAPALESSNILVGLDAWTSVF